MALQVLAKDNILLNQQVATKEEDLLLLAIRRCNYGKWFI